MVDSVDEIELLKNENINKEPDRGKAKASSTPATRLHRPARHQPLVVIFPQFLEVDSLLLHLQRLP